MTANLNGKDVSRDALRDALTASGLTPTFEWLRVDTLKGPEYQRPLKVGWAKRIARNLILGKMRPLVVSRRADGDYVLDGQHRVYAIRDVLNHHDQALLCEVYSGLTLAQETEMYSAQTALSRKPLSALESLHADYLGGVPDAVGVVLTVKRAGLAVDWTVAAGESTIRAAHTLRSLYDTRGPAHLLAVLQALRDVFGTEARVYQSEMIIGMSAFLTRYADHEYFSHNELVRKVGALALDEVLQKSRLIGAALGSRSAAGAFVGRALLGFYNSGKRSKTLPDWEVIAKRPEDAEQQRAARLSATAKRDHQAGIRPITGAVGEAMKRRAIANQDAAD